MVTHMPKQQERILKRVVATIRSNNNNYGVCVRRALSILGFVGAIYHLHPYYDYLSNTNNSSGGGVYNDFLATVITTNDNDNKTTTTDTTTGLADVSSSNATAASTPTTWDVLTCPEGTLGRTHPEQTIKIKKNVLIKTKTGQGGDWGNNLSPYWAARAKAELGGYEFQGDRFGSKSQGSEWMQYLPNSTQAKYPNVEAYNQFCYCRDDNPRIIPQNRYKYWHACQYGWNLIYETIRRDTRNAMEKWISRQQPQQSEQDAVYKLMQPNDWLIYDRCCLYKAGQYGTGTLSTYSAIVPTTGDRNEHFTVYAMSGRSEDQYNLCPEYHRIRDEYLKSRYPNIRIVHLPKNQKWIDFARIVYAPNVLIPSTGSSWALWSSLANTNNVVTVPFFDGMDVSVYPPNFRVLTNATLLYPLHKHEGTAKLVGSNDRKFGLTKEGRARLIDCYRDMC